MKPIIGLNCDVELCEPRDRNKIKLWRDYVAAVELAGGVPVLLPFTKNLADINRQLDSVDGLVLTGGDDYSPTHYGARKHPRTELIHADRERHDLKLAQLAIKRKMPIFGICGGQQLVNIVQGGTLVQHVPDVVGSNVHSGPLYKEAHPVEIWPGTRLAQIVRKFEIKVNSFHHQSADIVGRGLRVSAISTDGIIEAIEGDGDAFLVCVQWHPERMLNDRRQVALFKALVRESDDFRIARAKGRR